MFLKTKKLTITQKPRADHETVLMHTDNIRPDITLFKDIYSKPWTRDPLNTDEMFYHGYFYTPWRSMLNLFSNLINLEHSIEITGVFLALSI